MERPIGLKMENILNGPFLTASSVESLLYENKTVKSFTFEEIFLVKTATFRKKILWKIRIKHHNNRWIVYECHEDCD